MQKTPKIYWLLMLITLMMSSGCTTLASKPDDLSQENLITLKQQANTAYESKDYITALPLHQELNRQVPNDAYLWLRTGNIHARLNQPVLAIESYQNALRNDASLSKAWHNMGILQLRQAANTFTQMLQNLRPDDPLYKRAVDLSEATLKILGQQNNGTTATN